ncbi:MAG: hypothetical protein ABSH20_06100 [Tepidisphaeraceae bacterium]|jgi:hypothetical protein
MSDASDNPVSPELAAMPADELRLLAESIGLEPARFGAPLRLVLAVQQRQAAIAAMDREAMLEVIRWGRRPVSRTADNLTIAREIVCIKSMRFDGLSPRGLAVLATLRGVEFEPSAAPEELIRGLRKQEGLFAKLARKKRRWLGSIVSNMLGGGETDEEEYKFVPPADATGEPAPPGTMEVSHAATLKDEIEEAGLLGGLAGRIKRTADSYLKEKLDEIETRIDKKLDDIDHRLAEWRDKEVANRLRIIKITLWASLIVAGISLIYSFVKVYIVPLFAH